MVNPDAISHRTLDQGNNRSAHNRHIHQTGPVSRQRPQLGNAQSEDAREHDGVEEPHANHAPHRQVSAREHGNQDQRRGTNGAYRE